MSAVHDQGRHGYLGQQAMTSISSKVPRSLTGFQETMLHAGVREASGSFRRGRVRKHPGTEHFLNAECSSPHPSRMSVRKVFTSKPLRGVARSSRAHTRREVPFSTPVRDNEQRAQWIANFPAICLEVVRAKTQSINNGVQIMLKRFEQTSATSQSERPLHRPS